MLTSAKLQKQVRFINISCFISCYQSIFFIARIVFLESELQKVKCDVEKYQETISSKDVLITELEQKMTTLKEEQQKEIEDADDVHQKTIAEKDNLINKTQISLGELEEKFKSLQEELNEIRESEVKKDELIAKLRNNSKMDQSDFIHQDSPALFGKKIDQSMFIVNLCCFEQLTEPSIKFNSNEVQFTGNKMI